MRGWRPRGLVSPRSALEAALQSLGQSLGVAGDHVLLIGGDDQDLDLGVGLGDLQDAFYYFKNESEDQFSDDDLIEFMEKVFNGQAHGSTDVLTTISLEQLCRWARNDFDDRYADEEAFW